jgi:hypothetical protein
MPNIGVYHPLIVHFVIALLVIGVLSAGLLSGRALFTGPAAATCCCSAPALPFAARSGTDAHGPVEAHPGVRQAVQIRRGGRMGAQRLPDRNALRSRPPWRSGATSTQRAARQGSVVGVFGVAALARRPTGA